MGTWLATVRFPDGAVRYTRYSTVVESVDESLHPAVCRVGETLPSGAVCDRAEAVGESLPSARTAPLSPVGELVLVTIEWEPDADVWHAVYCPNRGQVVGPHSSHYRYRLQEEFDLIRDEAGVRHLCRWAGEDTECGRRVTGGTGPVRRVGRAGPVPPVLSGLAHRTRC
jgi:hypothetical protein